MVTFDAEAEGLEVAALARSVNGLCGPEVAVRAAEVVPPAFDARHSARARCYRYQILNAAAPDPFLARTAWHVEAPLDRAMLRLASDPLIGEHDFSSFCRRPDEGATLVRRVHEARWEEAGEGVLWFWIEANAFCHQMVRSITGTIVETGRGKKRPGDIMGIIRARDRHAAGDLAPAHGLCLWAVRYG